MLDLASHIDRHFLRATVALAALCAAPIAQANCEALAKSASTVSPDKLGETYAQLVACDPKLAEEAFDEFMRASKDLDTLRAVSLAAIDNKVHKPVYPMLEKVQDLGLRDEVAKAVGADCETHPEVVGFLKGAYTELRDRQFGMWREAYRSCNSPELDAWLAEVSTNPPSVSYDEKYNVVTESLAKRSRVEALPVLAKAAAAAAGNGGPFTTLLDRMEDAVKPDTFGADIAEEDRQKLEEALVGVAKHVEPDHAKQVADRLYQAGAEAAAASLLPAVYPDRVKDGKSIQYGVAAIESCDKEAIIHYAEVSEPGKRWSIAQDVEGPAREFKPKLKCQAEGDWPVMTTPEPLGKKGLDEWLASLESDWAGKELDVKLKEEKGITLE